MMNSKMKGLLKGLRYISHIFEPDSEEDEGELEMQIGYPTDVKHVAHIGWDGPSVNSPSWMNEFRSTPLNSVGADAMGELDPSRFPSHDLDHNARIVQGSSIHETRKATADSPGQNNHQMEPPIPKPSRRHWSSGAAASSSENPCKPESPSSFQRQSRRNKSSEAATTSASVDDNSEGSTRRTRRQNRVKESGGDSTAKDLLPIPNNARKKKKKPKGSIGEGSTGSSTTRSSRSKGVATGYSDPGLLPLRRAELGPAIKPIGE